MVKSVISWPPLVLPRKTGISSAWEVLIYQWGYWADSNSTLSLISVLWKTKRFSIFLFGYFLGSTICSKTERRVFVREGLRCSAKDVLWFGRRGS